MFKCYLAIVHFSQEDHAYILSFYFQLKLIREQKLLITKRKYNYSFLIIRVLVLEFDWGLGNY